MKEGWEYKKLGEVATYVNGFAFKPSDWTDNGLPIIRIQNLTNSTATFHRCNREDIPDKYKIKCGEILISWSATLGVYEWLGENALLNQHIFKVEFNKVNINKKYFEFAVKSSLSEMAKHTNGATMRHIRKGDFDNITIPVPSLSEQQRIVTYLDSAFAKIDAVAKNAEASLNEAKALFQSALAKMMEPKEGWEEVTLDNICSIESTLVDPTDDNYNNLLHVGGANIESYTGRLINLMTAKDERLTSGKYLFDSNVVLYNKVRPYLVKVARPDFNGLCSADMYPLTPKKETTREFLYYLLIKKEFTNYAIKCSARAGMPKINRNSLFAYKASIPLNRKEQIRIVSTLDNIRKVLMHLESNLSRTLTECTALKQAILRQTFE